MSSWVIEEALLFSITPFNILITFFLPWKNPFSLLPIQKPIEMMAERDKSLENIPGTHDGNLCQECWWAVTVFLPPAYQTPFWRSHRWRLIQFPWSTWREWTVPSEQNYDTNVRLNPVWFTNSTVLWSS